MPKTMPVTIEAIEKCTTEIGKIPTFCVPGLVVDKLQPWHYEECNKYINPAAECLKGLNLPCAKPTPDFWDSELHKHFTPRYWLLKNVNRELKKLSKPLADTIASAIRDVYFASIANCNPDLIGTVADVLVKLINKGKFGEVVDYVKKTSITDVTTKRLGIFSNKPATLLLIKVLMTTQPGKPSDYYLDKATEFFPLLKSDVPNITESITCAHIRADEFKEYSGIFVISADEYIGESDKFYISSRDGNELVLDYYDDYVQDRIREFDFGCAQKYRSDIQKCEKNLEKCQDKKDSNKNECNTKYAECIKKAKEKVIIEQYK